MHTTERTFETFVDNFVAKVSRLEKDYQLASWRLYTEVSPENEINLALTNVAYTKAYADKALYDELMVFYKSDEINNPLLARQLKLLILAFQGNMLPDDLIKEIATKSASLEATFAGFRPILNGKQVTDNEVSECSSPNWT